MNRAFILSTLSLSLFALAAGCGDGSGGSGGGGSTSTGGSTGGSTSTGDSTGGTVLLTGDCQGDADCNGGTCVEVTPGGYKVCTSMPVEATMCSGTGMPPDECCASADCAEGKCYLSTDLPYCGGPAMATYNRCVTDGCATDADCGTNAICAPVGAFGNPVRACFPAFCKTNADCGDGSCAPIQDSCCAEPAGLACVKAGGCQKDSDCAADGSQYCDIDAATKSSVCKMGGKPCPA